LFVEVEAAQGSPMGDEISRAAYYRSRAEKIRASALACIEAAIKDQLETLAKHYEVLALSAERTQQG
jgi:hypothetical protein